MSLLDSLSSLSTAKSDCSETSSLNTETMVGNLHSYFDSIIFGAPQPVRKNSSSSSDLQQLSSKVVLACDQGNQLLQAQMPTGEEMLYRCGITKHMLRCQEFISEEELERPELRQELIVWIVKLHAKSKFKFQALYRAVRIIDRYLCKVNLSAEAYNCLGATALWMAVKLEQPYRHKFGDWVSAMVEGVSADSIIDMQAQIMEKCDYQLVVPNVYSFFQIALTYVPVRKRTWSLCHYLLELSIQESKYMCFADNVVAAAVVYLGVQALDPSTWNQVLIHALGVRLSEVRNCARQLLESMKLSQKYGAGTSFRKYSKSKFHKVALIKF